jgi:N-acyl-D-amino-acid deacylase
VVFDENTVTDLATFEQPHQLSTGFSYVLVNGQVTVDQGKHIGTRAGKVIRWNGGK